MKISFYYLLLIFCLSMTFSCQAQNKNKAADSPYSYKTASYDGIGKVYMGREISFVMGFEGKDWLERQSREREESISLALENLPLTPESIVADLGAGSGYFTFRIAPRVPKGQVYAVEIQDEAIKFLQKRAKELGILNVIPVKGSEQSLNLPANSLDLVIMVDVYHELEFPQEMLIAVRESLKPSGKLLLIEYRGEDPAVAIKPLHKMTVKQAEKELKNNGFKLVENGQFLKIQHFLIFEKEN
jgi:ubiquinone/menaquinone biosynthesis C-methylase UbiE